MYMNKVLRTIRASGKVMLTRNRLAMKTWRYWALLVIALELSLIIAGGLAGGLQHILDFDRSATPFLRFVQCMLFFVIGVPMLPIFTTSARQVAQQLGWHYLGDVWLRAGAEKPGFLAQTKTALFTKQLPRQFTSVMQGTLAGMNSYLFRYSIGDNSVEYTVLTIELPQALPQFVIHGHSTYELTSFIDANLRRSIRLEGSFGDQFDVLVAADESDSHIQALSFLAPNVMEVWQKHLPNCSLISDGKSVSVVTTADLYTLNSLPELVAQFGNFIPQILRKLALQSHRTSKNAAVVNELPWYSGGDQMTPYRDIETPQNLSTREKIGWYINRFSAHSIIAILAILSCALLAVGYAGSIKQTPRQVADTYIAHLVAEQPNKSLELEIDGLRNNPSHESVLSNIRLKNYRVYLVANDENTFVYRFDNNSSQGYYIRLQLHEGVWSNRVSGFTSSYLPLDLSWIPR